MLLRVQAGRIGSTAVMQLTEHDMTIYSAAHPQTEVSANATSGSISTSCQPLLRHTHMHTGFFLGALDWFWTYKLTRHAYCIG